MPLVMDDTDRQAEPSSLPAIFILIFAALFLLDMHYFQFNFGGSGLHLPFNASSWLFISGLVAVSLLQIAKNQRLIYSAFSLHFLLIVALLCVPLIYPGSWAVIEQSVPRLLGLLVGALLFIGLQQFSFTKNQLHLLLYIVLGGVLIEALLGLVQYYLMGLWPVIDGKIIGFSAASMRPFGIFQQPNVMATFMSTGLVLAFYLLLKNAWHQQYFWAKLLVYAAPLLAGLVLVLNLSRTGLISAVIGLALLLPLALKTKPKRALSWLLLLAVAVSLAVFSFQSSEQPGRNLEQMAKPGARLPTYLHSLAMIKHKPLLGWGYGSFEQAFLSSSKRVASPYKDLNFGHLDHPHNELLYWAIEGGVVPVLALGYAAWLIFSLLINVGKQHKAEGMALLALLVPILLHTQTEYPFYHAIVLWVLFVFLLFLADKQSATVKTIAWPPAFMLRALALLIPLYALWFIFTTLSTCYFLAQFERGGFKEPRLIKKISNPLAFETRYHWDIMSIKLRQAIAQDSQPGLLEFERWVEQVVQHTPRPEFYQNWIVSLQLQGKQVQAQKVQQEAKRLYPHFFIH